MIFLGLLVISVATGFTSASPRKMAEDLSPISGDWRSPWLPTMSEEDTGRTILSRALDVTSEKPVYKADPNLDSHWVTHIKKAPVIMSFHDKVDSPVLAAPFASLAEFFERLLLCPLFAQLDKPDSDPTKNQTAVLFTDTDAKEITIVLTDNKTYFVGIASKDGIMTVDRFVLELDPVEEQKIKDKFKELGYRYTPSTTVKKSDCIGAVGKP